ncbi:MAG: hypothetical protein P4L11_13675 [Geothrix sp.]|nr:hypothetical protein [Geothrix sp.]
MLHVADVINMLPGTSIAYKGDGGIVDELFNTIPVELEAGTYTQFGREFAFRLEDPSMSRLGEAKEIDFSEAQVPYMTRPEALKAAIPYDLENLTPVQVNRIQQSVQGLTDTLNRWREKKGAALIASFATDAVGTSWAQDAADPIKDAKTLAQKLAMPANVAVVGKRVYDRLIYHPKVVALRANTRPGSITRQDLASILEVDQVLVPTMKANTAVRGRAEVLDYLWGDLFWMGYKAPTQEIGTEQITFGAMIQVQNFTLKGANRESQVYASSEKGTLVRVWEDENRGFAGTAMVQVGRKYSMAQVATDLGRGLSGLLA